MIRLFRHYVPRGLLVLAVLEALIFIGSVYLGKALTVISYEIELNDASLSEAMAAYLRAPPELAEAYGQGLLMAVVMVGMLTAMGLYERNFWDGKGDMILRVGISFVLGFFALALVFFLLPTWRLHRREFSLAFSLAFVGIMMVRYGFLKVVDQASLRRRVLVLGGGKRAAEIERLADHEAAGFTAVGFVPMAGETTVVGRSKIIQANSTLFELSQHKRVDEIVIALDDRRSGALPMDDILDCKINGMHVSDFSPFIERETGKITLASLHPSDMIFSDGFHQAVLQTNSKRLFDIVVSLILLFIALPFMVMTALAVWLESGGRDPVLYRQERVGKNERIFQVIKFRSMRVDAEQDGQARWAQKNDPRVTRIGAFIRRVRLDELPQLINVLLGQMSFVGPRPERPALVAELQRAIPYYSLRHCVKPGITGWAQLCYPYGNTIEDARRKLEYDLYYIKNYSLFLDCIVLLQTAHVVLWAKGH